MTTLLNCLRYTAQANGAAYLEEVQLDLLLGEPGPVVLLGLLLLENETEVLAGEGALQLLNLGEQVKLELVGLGLDLGCGGSSSGRGRVAREGDVSS